MLFLSDGVPQSSGNTLGFVLNWKCSILQTGTEGVIELNEYDNNHFQELAEEYSIKIGIIFLYSYL